MTIQCHTELNKEEDERSMEILTVEETADYLKVPVNQVYTLVRCDDFPAFKVGKHWRILKDRLDEWIKRQVDYR